MTFERPPGLMTASEAARLAGIGRYRVWMLCAAGEMQAVQLAGYPLLVREESVRAWTAKRGAAGTKPGPKPKPKPSRPGAAGKKHQPAAK